MMVFTPCIENFSSSGYTAVQRYLGVSLPDYAEVAAGTPGSGVASQLFGELADVMIDCHQSGWDGHGAEAITPEAYEIAYRFIRSLPAGIPRPTISANPDGCFTFEWHVSPRRLVLASVHPNFRVDYAALFGTSKNYGSEAFFDSFPTGICDLVRRLYQV